MTTILGITIAVLTVALVGIAAWLAWDTERIEQRCREDER